MGSTVMTRRRLVGRAELRKLFGVSATRTVQIADREDFPPPADELTVGKIWLLDDVVAWAHTTGRTLHFDALYPPDTTEAGNSAGTSTVQREP
jgi:hypothetical protein